MSKSSIATFSFVIVCGLLLAACQTQPAAKIEEKTSVTIAAVSPTVTAPTLAVAPGSKVASTETSYQSPGGEEKVGFRLVVNANGIITDAQTDVLGKSPTTKMRQESFAKSFPEAVVGKKLSELQAIDRVGGSSLTTGAFNKALATLKTSI